MSSAVRKVVLALSDNDYDEEKTFAKLQETGFHHSELPDDITDIPNTTTKCDISFIDQKTIDKINESGLLIVKSNKRLREETNKVQSIAKKLRESCQRCLDLRLLKITDDDDIPNDAVKCGCGIYKCTLCTFKKVCRATAEEKDENQCEDEYFCSSCQGPYCTFCGNFICSVHFQKCMGSGNLGCNSVTCNECLECDERHDELSKIGDYSNCVCYSCKSYMCAKHSRPGRHASYYGPTWYCSQIC